MKITQKNFDILANNLNHKMTKMETDVKWMKRIGYYMATIMTAMLGKMFI